MTNDGRLFHARAAATGKARSPIVLQRVTGTATAVDELERWLRLVVTSVARLMLSARYTGAVPFRDQKTGRLILFLNGSFASGKSKEYSISVFKYWLQSCKKFLSKHFSKNAWLWQTVAKLWRHKLCAVAVFEPPCNVRHGQDCYEVKHLSESCSVLQNDALASKKHLGSASFGVTNIMMMTMILADC